MRPTALLPLVPLLAALVAAVPAHARLDSAWRAVPARVPADSLPPLLLGWEQRGGPDVRPGEAGYALGQFRYARGEFEAAAGAYQRAAARLDGDDRQCARYGWALATFALGHPAAARAAFEEVARTNAPVRALAALGAAQCWEAEGHPDRALDVLQRLVAGDAGEATPAALERYAALALRVHRDRDAAEARQKLVRLWPHSFEAQRALGAPPPPAAKRPAPERLETGALPRKGKP